jgi:hypothetical protein
MNSHETMMEQIRRLNREEQIKHEQRRAEAINKIKEFRARQRLKEQNELHLPQ